MDYERTREVLTALEREGVQYVIFGAVALNLQGLARATLDLDIFIAPDEATVRPQDLGDAERLRQRFGFEDE